MSETILTPIMTSNTEPSGEVSASSTYQTRYPWHAFTQNENGDIYYNWASNGTSGGEWIQYQFTKAQKVTKIDFYNRNASDGYYPTQLTVKGSNDETNWTELGVYTSFNSGAKAKTTLVIEHPSNYKIYRLIFDSMTPSANGYAGASRIDLIGDSGKHSKSSGSTEAIRDWLNASLYNKEEIDELFIRNNQAGLIPYDLMITGDQPEQMIKLVGQTSGKTYNICLAAILGDDMKETVLWENSGSTRPSTITLNDDWTKYKWLLFCATISINNNRYLETYIYSTSFIKKAIQNNSGATIALCFNAYSSDFLWYGLSNNTLTYMDAGGNNPIPTSILGYS